MATGYFGTPNLLHVPGESLPHVTHLYHEGHDAFRRDVVVVGGGNSAVDAALDLWRCGAKVTLVHFREHLDDNVKPWVLPDITNRLKDGSIAARWNARVTRIDVDTVSIDGPQGPQTLRANHVYLMTGFTPSTGAAPATRGVDRRRHGDPGARPVHDGDGRGACVRGRGAGERL